MKRLIICLIVILYAISGITPLAIAYDVNSTLEIIEYFSAKGDISQSQAVLYKTYALFDSKKLPPNLRVEDRSEDSWFCATMQILEIKRNLPLASQVVQEAVSHYLTKPPAGIIQRDKSGLGFNPDGFYTSNDYQTEHFNIKWGSQNITFTQSDIVSMGESFENAWTTMVDDWEFDPVFYSDQFYVDVYLANTGDQTPELEGYGGYAADYPTTGMPYIVLTSNLFSFLEIQAEAIVHEFFHLIEHAAVHKPGGCLDYWTPENGWAIEGCAVWSQIAVLGKSNFSMDPIKAYADNPYFTLDSTDGDQIYARVIWWQYISENFGGVPTIYALWNNPCQESILASINVILADQDTNLWSEFMNFNVANLFKEYEEGYMYPDFHIERTISEYPVTYQPAQDRKPQVFGTNYLELMPPSSKGGNYTLDISFAGETADQKTYSEYWYVQIAAITGQDTYDLIIMDIESGEGQATLEGFGIDYTTAYLIISPYTFTFESRPAVNYSVSAEVTALPDDDDDDDDNDNNDSLDDDDNNDDSSPGGGGGQSPTDTESDDDDDAGESCSC